jgi:hypothetical protein
MRISYKPAGFNTPNPRLQPGDRTLFFTRAALERSVATVGRRYITDVLQFGDLSILEIIWRTAMLLANVQKRSDDWIEWSPAYGGLDPSERGAVSYFVGMTFAKLMSERLLRVPWLLHLDLYRDNLDPTFYDGETRPDLVGLTITGDWIAVEAKGGAGNLKSAGWTRAKEQLANLETVNGAAVHLRVAAVTFQRRQNRVPRLHVEFRDPPSDRRGFDLPVSPEQFVSDYYERIRRLIGEEYQVLPGVVSATGSPCLGAYIPAVDLWIGIAQEIARSPKPYESAMAYAERAVGRNGANDTTRTSELIDVGIDGVAVVLGASWDTHFTPAVESPGEDAPERRR